jgi:hypothetical protein
LLDSDRLSIIALESTAMRQIRDDAGNDWVVYEVSPMNNHWTAIGSLPEGYRGGWLCFESASEKRRLSPAPSGWEDLSLDALNGLLGTAVQVRRSPKPTIQAPPPPRL